MNGMNVNSSRRLPRAEEPSGLLLHPRNPPATTSAAARPLARHAPRAAAVEAPHLWIPDQRTHSLTAKGRDVIDSMGSWAQQKLLPYLKTVEHSWQPADWLPDASSPDFYDQVRFRPIILCRAMSVVPSISHPQYRGMVSTLLPAACRCF